MVHDILRINVMKHKSVDENFVYVLIFISSNWTELIGVYSTEEKAKLTKDIFISSLSKCGSICWDGLQIIRKKVDEQG